MVLGIDAYPVFFFSGEGVGQEGANNLSTVMDVQTPKSLTPLIRVPWTPMEAPPADPLKRLGLFTGHW